MNNYERYAEYVELQCSNCKNRNTDLCDIRINSLDGIIKTRCVYYVREKKPQGFERVLKRNAKQQKPLMKLRQEY